MPTKVEISHRTIIFTFLFLIFIWFLWQIRDILLLLFISLILMSTLNPAVDRLEKIKIPRGIAILLIYLLVFAVLAGSFATLIIPLVEQTTLFFNRIPLYLDQLDLFQINPSVISSQLGSIPQNALKLISGAVSNIIGLFTVAVFTFYLLLERKNLNRYLNILFGDHGERKGEELINKIENRLGHWIRGQLSLCVIVGIMVYIGLIVLGIDYALPLALIAGILEIVPNLGPTLSAVPAVLVGLANSPILGAAVVALYFLVQQLENTVIVPNVMKKAVGLNPLITLFSLLVGFKIAGLVGAVLAVPIVLVLIAIAPEVYSSKKFQNFGQ